MVFTRSAFTFANSNTSQKSFAIPGCCTDAAVTDDVLDRQLRDVVGLVQCPHQRGEPLDDACSDDFPSDVVREMVRQKIGVAFRERNGDVL